MRLLHIIPQIDAGGPARGLLALGRQTAVQSLPVEHRVVAMARQANGSLVAALARQGMFPLLAPAPTTIAGQVAEADVVVIHFWTAPALAELLASPLPPCRVAIWFQVAGNHPPQCLLPAHFDFADAVVLTAPSDQRSDADLVPGLADFSRVEPPSAAVERDAVTFLGTLNRAKLHPDFFALSDRIDAPGWRFPVVGGPLDDWFKPRHAATRDPSRYEIPGFVEDIGRLFARTAVFGYPLERQTYAGSDKTVQEAMWSAVPPVVIAGRGPAFWVADGETGRVAASDDAYPALVAELLDRPAERRRLGAAAAHFARTAFDPAANARRLYERLVQLAGHPKRARAAIFAAPPDTPEAACPAAYRLARGFGDAGRPLLAALADPIPAKARTAAHALAALSPIARSAEGGVFHFRNHHPDDFALRLWAGVLLTTSGNSGRAAAEFAAAATCGAPPALADAYRLAADEISDALAPYPNDRK